MLDQEEDAEGMDDGFEGKGAKCDRCEFADADDGAIAVAAAAAATVAVADGGTDAGAAPSTLICGGGATLPGAGSMPLRLMSKCPDAAASWRWCWC